MIKWQCTKFTELNVHELYAILQLRSEVFVVEQNCVYQDADDKDQESWHMMGWRDKKLVAYTRLLPPGLAYEYPSIGRVVTTGVDRRTGIGKELMERSIREVYTLFGPGPIKIGAQLYLTKFYTGLGFVQEGEAYLEDGIEHIHMIRR